MGRPLGRGRAEPCGRPGQVGRGKRRVRVRDQGAGGQAAPRGVDGRRRRGQRRRATDRRGGLRGAPRAGRAVRGVPQAAGAPNGEAAISTLGHARVAPEARRSPATLLRGRAEGGGQRRRRYTQLCLRSPKGPVHGQQAHIPAQDAHRGADSHGQEPLLPWICEHDHRPACPPARPRLWGRRHSAEEGHGRVQTEGLRQLGDSDSLTRQLCGNAVNIARCVEFVSLYLSSSSRCAQLYRLSPVVFSAPIGASSVWLMSPRLQIGSSAILFIAGSLRLLMRAPP
mmetsp:Transcript_99426/g.259213  ORF Transcript_99426/g.259213 Transcript_99426/m.259213 type:complete len:283 (+) Transcript_99426:1296-2144(+)